MCESKEYRIPRLQEAYLDDEARGAAYLDHRMNGTFEMAKEKTARDQTARDKAVKGKTVRAKEGGE